METEEGWATSRKMRGTWRREPDAATAYTQRRVTTERSQKNGRGGEERSPRLCLCLAREEGV